VLEQEVQSPIGLNAMAEVRSASSEMMRVAGAYEAASDRPIVAVDLGSLAREAASMIRHLSNRMRVKIDLDASMEGWVQAIEDDLRTGIYGLLSRAIHVSPAGQVVSLSVHRHRDDIILQLRDFGPDLPRPHLSQLLDSSSDLVTRTAAKTAKYAVESAGGTLSSSNHLQGGAVFTMRIPAMDSLSS